MRKASLLLAIMVILVGDASVQAQKKSPEARFLQPIIQLKNVVLQDDSGGGFLMFDPVSGAYKSNLCEYGFTFSGIGQVRVDGCNVYFSDIQPGYRIFASFNMCDHQAKCALEIFELPQLGFEIEPIREYWTDTNLLNNTAECGGEISPK